MLSPTSGLLGKDLENLASPIKQALRQGGTFLAALVSLMSPLNRIFWKKGKIREKEDKYEKYGNGAN